MRTVFDEYRRVMGCSPEEEIVNKIESVVRPAPYLVYSYAEEAMRVIAAGFLTDIGDNLERLLMYLESTVEIYDNTPKFTKELFLKHMLQSDIPQDYLVEVAQVNLKGIDKAQFEHTMIKVIALLTYANLNMKDKELIIEQADNEEWVNMFYKELIERW